MRFWRRLAILVALVAMLGFPALLSRAQPPSSVWEFVDESSISPVGERRIIPERYLTLRLDLPALERQLQGLPRLHSGEPGRILALPMPDGTFARFEVWDAPVMAPELAAKFPGIRTFAGQGLDDPAATVRFDITYHGFHAMILSPQGAVFIDPYSTGDTTHYITYAKRDYTRTTLFQEGPIQLAPGTVLKGPRATHADANGSQLRTYRTAVAATGEYTQYHGGTVQDGMSAITTAINRVNEVYERDFAIHLELIPNNDQIVYTDPDTDPYTNSDGNAMLDENQSNLDSVIGSANYDIGHVFSTGGGGVAYLGSVCVNGSKAKGVTGLPDPIGDTFYIDYVAHEMGHQFGGNHTFAGNEGSCLGNINVATSYEPGSGATIMAYAGICGSQNLQDHSDDYFHSGSLEEVINFITTGSGSTCGSVSSTGNTPPTANPGTGNFTIPADTPFRLFGSGSDSDGDSLTYMWEGLDHAPNFFGTTPGSGKPPFFRSFQPDADPPRTFPQMSDIINNTQTIGEELPTDSRTLTFRFVVRDNRVGGGGVDWGDISFDVTANAGPFRVTAPNTAVTWQANTSETVTWDVANTDAAPVSCSQVDILLSDDGGWNYPITLAAGTPNDGSETITVPNINTTQARVQVQCADARFFDLSDADFTIEAVAVAPTDLQIQLVNSEAELSWTHIEPNTDYEIWRHTSPYFDPAAGEGTLADTLPASTGVMTYTDPGRVGDPATNYFWAVRGTVGSSVSPVDAWVGEFDFALTPGTP